MSTARLDKLKETEQQKPDDAFVKFAIAQELVSVNKLDEARTYFELLAEKYPDYLGTYYHFGKLCEQMNDKSTASDLYFKGLLVARKAKDIKAVGELSDALMHLEEDDE